ncbi:zf-HC2 domain-containing protein [Fontivita pretiosa]|uniref:anti-sigma factor n=1 Tax=Fontivita pretiosa TaxID=2989684 RepID=UPI003D174803
MARTEDIEAKLAAYVDGELDEAQRAQIEMHLSSNPQHRQLIEELIQQRQLLRQLPRAMAPPDIAESLTAQLERAVLLGDVDAEVQAASRRIGHWRQLRMAAAVLVLLGALLAVIIQLLPSPNQRLPEIADLRPSPLEPSATTLLDETAERADKKMTGDAEQPAEHTAMVDAASRSAKIADTPEIHAAPTLLGKGGTATQEPLAAAETEQRRAFQEPSAPQNQVVSNVASAGQQMFRQTVTDQILGQIDGATGGAQTPLVYVVRTDDPQGTQRHLETVLRDNGISWTAQVDPLPPPLELGAAQQQAIHGSRFQQQQVQMKGDWGTGTALGGAGQIPQPGQTTEQQPDASQVSSPPAQTQARPPQVVQSPAQLSEQRLEQDRQAVHRGQAGQGATLVTSDAISVMPSGAITPQQIANRFEARRLTPQQLQAVSVALGPRARQVSANRLGTIELAGEESLTLHHPLQQQYPQPGRLAAESPQAAQTVEPAGQMEQATRELGRPAESAVRESTAAQNLAIATTQPAEGQAAPGEQASPPATMTASVAKSAITGPTTLGVQPELIDVVIYVLANPAGATTQPSTQATGGAEPLAVEPPAAPPPTAAPTTAATQGSSVPQ